MLTFPSLAGGDEEEGEKTCLNPTIYNPNPTPPLVEGAEFLTFYEVVKKRDSNDRVACFSLISTDS